LNFLGDADEADEAAQLVFVQMYQSLPRARLDIPLKPWIYRVARNKCIDLWRAHTALSLAAQEEQTEDTETGGIEPADSMPLPDELAERNDLQQLLRAAINALPVKYRTVVTLRYINELSFAEIGHTMGIPENTAKTYFQRAKTHLRRKLSGLT
jgi:RNA polymerase sigma-70 factor (ECF subfamily)